MKLSKQYKDSLNQNVKQTTDQVSIQRHKYEKPYCRQCNHVTKEKGIMNGHADKANTTLHYFCRIHGRLSPDEVYWQ